MATKLDETKYKLASETETTAIKAAIATGAPIPAGFGFDGERYLKLTDAERKRIEDHNKTRRDAALKAADDNADLIAVNSSAEAIAQAPRGGK